nr:protein-L-isoaspartate O-methyltransferase [Candidatus Sigynarchaeota archaeon]
RHSNPLSHVYTIERIPELGNRASAVINKLGYGDMISVIVGDGTVGYPEKAPYDRILVTAAAPRVPDALFEQLVVGGTMLIPVGEKHGYQELLSITKENGALKRKNICGVAFVPLVGSQGFDE